MVAVQVYSSLPASMLPKRPELLLVERQIAMAPIQEWRERVAADGIDIFIEPEDAVVDFAQLWHGIGNTIDAAIVDLDRPWGFPDVDPEALVTSLRSFWPKLFLTFFSTRPAWQHRIGSIPPPVLLYHREEETPYQFLENLRPYLLKVPPDRTENAPSA